jgi:hypothetical protein
LWWLLRPCNLQQMWQTLRNSGSQSFRNKLRQVLRSLPPAHFFTKHHSTCTSKSVFFIAFITFNHWQENSQNKNTEVIFDIVTLNTI